MISDDLRFVEGVATEEEIQSHLELCDAVFLPKLSSKVDIAEYAAKIRLRAITFEAWSRRNLVGLVAIYVNDRATRTGFITNVSVSRPFAGRGIATALLNQALVRAREEGMRAVRLEVGAQSLDAIRLYAKLGFSVIANGTDVVLMELAIGE